MLIIPPHILWSCVVSNRCKVILNVMQIINDFFCASHGFKIHDPSYYVQHDLKDVEKTTKAELRILASGIGPLEDRAQINLVFTVWLTIMMDPLI